VASSVAFNPTRRSHTNALNSAKSGRHQAAPEIASQIDLICARAVIL